MVVLVATTSSSTIVTVVPALLFLALIRACLFFVPLRLTRNRENRLNKKRTLEFAKAKPRHPKPKPKGESANLKP